MVLFLWRWARRHRVIRFALSGGCAAACQIALMVALSRAVMDGIPANFLAFGLAAQVNFMLSHTFTWGDRSGGSILARWVRYLTTISTTAGLNLGVFLVLRTALPEPMAALGGIAFAGTVNFLVADRAIFRPARIPARASSLAPVEVRRDV